MNDPGTIPAASPTTAPATGRPRTLDDLPGPRPLPVLGNLTQVRVSRLHSSLEAWAHRYGPSYQLRMGRRPMLVTRDPDIVHEVLRRRPDDFRRSPQLAPVLDEMIGGTGVFHAEGEAWRRHRALASRALDARHVHQFLPTMTEITDRLRRRLSEAADSGRVVDIQGDLMRYTVDVTASLVFGHDIDTLSGDADVIQRHLAQVLPRLIHRMMAPVAYWRVVRLPADRRLDRAMDEVRAYCTDLVERTRSAMAAEPTRSARPTDLLEAMLAADADDDLRLTPEDVVANMLTMLVAGEDTTANTIAWAVLELGGSPSSVARLRTEADTLDPAEPQAVLDPRRLRWTDAVVAETMRLRPVVPVIFHGAIRDVVVGDIALPAGAAVALLTRPSGTDAGLVEDPDRFRPQRWLAPRSESGDWRADQTPFGGGARFCPGRGLAMVESRLVLTMLFREFDIELVSDPSEVREHYSFTMEPVGVAVRVRHRDQVPSAGRGIEGSPSVA